MSNRRAQDERIEGTPDGTSAITEISDVPDAPTIGAATNVGTSRAYNNGSATVAFTPNTTGGAVTTYTATSSPGSFTGTAATSPVTVAGLQSQTSYTFTVTGGNTTGTSAATAASNSITATTVPQAPTIGTATDLGTGTTASVTFTAGATGGSAITGYTVTSSPGSVTATGTSPVTITGLTAATTYTFTVTATNANGTSAASSASNSITPVVPKFGYMMSGYGWNTDAKVTSTDKLAYSTDTVSSTSIDVGALTAAGAFANSGVAGYRVSGNSNGGQQSTIQKIAFTNDAVSSVAATLSGTKIAAGTFANSGTAGYAAGGVSSGTTTTDKLTFSNDTRATIASRLPYALYTQAGFANSGTAGYVAGGNQSGATQHSAIHKLVFSNDTWTNNVSYLSAIADSFGAAGMANSGTAGYIAGGNYMTPQVPFDYAQALNIIAKVTFSNDSRSNLGTTLAAVSTWLGSHANSGTAGYVCGGSNSFRSNIQKLVFSNDTISTLAATLSEPKYQMAAMANSGTL